MSTTKSFHWSVKTHKIEELEKALNDYDEMGWEIFDVDVTAHAAVVVMRADHDKERPGTKVTKKKLPNGLKELPDKPLGRTR